MPVESAIIPVSQSTLADYTRTRLVVPRLREKDAAGIISELSSRLQREGFVSDVLPFYHAALNHELLSNSAHTCGIALPHGRLNGVRQLQFAFGRSPEPVSWGSKGSSPVQLIFLLAVPATDAVCYLHLLATLARLAQQPERLAALRTMDDPQGVLDLLDTIKLRL